MMIGKQFNAHGVTMNGGFAEYCAYPAAKVFKFKNLSWVDATLLEPASCACHGLEKIRPKLGSHVLMFGAGPTGLVSPVMPCDMMHSSIYIYICLFSHAP